MYLCGMSGLYLHIPFCKQACTYCDFHFSTTRTHQEAMVEALLREMEMRRDELGSEPLQTVYFGGGTPSVLSNAQLQALLQQAQSIFGIDSKAEITLEANPDDLDLPRMEQLRSLGVNRLSVGVQTFDEACLQLLHRAHNAQQARAVLRDIGQVFDQYSIDLMYGLPGLHMPDWERHIDLLVSAQVPHISCYALTVETKTVLHKQVQRTQVVLPDEVEVARQFERLMERLSRADYEHYEVSNFALLGQYAQHNTAYWQGKPYLGIGPSAHSFDGQTRSWNVSNNLKYIQAIAREELPLTRETLSVYDNYNEYIMTGLRTQWGVQASHIATAFGPALFAYFTRMALQAQQQGQLLEAHGQWKIPASARFLSDGIAANLFWVAD